MKKDCLFLCLRCCSQLPQPKRKNARTWTAHRMLLRCIALSIALGSGESTILAQPQSPPTTPPPGSRTIQEQPTATPLVSNSPTLEQRIALAEERIQDSKDRVENVYKLFGFVVAVATIFLVLFSIRDIFFRWKEGQRQRGIDDIVKEMMKLQNAAVDQQVRFGALQLWAAEQNPLAPVKNVSNVIEVVQRTLAFRLEQEKRVADTLKEIEQIKAERERSKKQKFDSALRLLEQFKKMSRMQFAKLTLEQQKQGVKLVELVRDLDESLDEKGVDVAGGLLYTSGVIAYYDNDVVEARTYLDRAAQYRATEHEAELTTNDDYRTRFAFIHFFRALIQKNWGDLSEALHEIERSAKLMDNRPGEFLTPVTKAEIRSYISGDEQRTRVELQDLTRQIAELESALNNEGKSLDANQIRLRSRMLLLLGNTHFVLRDYREALNRYAAALQFNKDDYYALFSAAQCEEALNEASARNHFRQCLEAIERSGDFERKHERSVRAVIAVIAGLAAKSCDEFTRYEKYAREASDMLSGNLDVGGLSPRFFSPTTKRLVNSNELLLELRKDGNISGHTA